MRQSSRRGLSLADRSALSGIGRAVEQGRTESGGRAFVGARHCWVLGILEPPGRLPGLLLEWRKHESKGWQGRTVYAADGEDGPVLVESWVAAEHLRPADDP